MPVKFDSAPKITLYTGSCFEQVRITQNNWLGQVFTVYKGLPQMEGQHVVRAISECRALTAHR